MKYTPIFALLITLLGCDKKPSNEGNTTNYGSPSEYRKVVQPDYGCRARTGTGVPFTNMEYGVGGVEYYSSYAGSKSAATREAREQYVINNPSAKKSKIRVNCWRCDTKGLDEKAEEICESR